MFESDVVCSVSAILLQHRSWCSVYLSFVRLDHHNG